MAIATTCKMTATTCKMTATTCKMTATTCKMTATTCKTTATTCKMTATTCKMTATTCKMTATTIPIAISSAFYVATVAAAATTAAAPGFHRPGLRGADAGEVLRAVAEQVHVVGQNLQCKMTATTCKMTATTFKMTATTIPIAISSAFYVATVAAATTTSAPGFPLPGLGRADAGEVLRAVAEQVHVVGQDLQGAGHREAACAETRTRRAF